MPKPKGKPSSPGSDIGLRRVGDPRGPDTFELVHPGSVRERAEDLQEVHVMLAAEEFEVAEDELRWLLAGCRPFVEAHQLLGRIAMERDDLELAEAHLRTAWELGEAALPRSRGCRLPYARPANRPWLEAGRALVECLRRQNRAKQADEFARRLVAIDPTDPFGFGATTHMDR